jgi:AcrR family transcriptional regulator
LLTAAEKVFTDKGYRDATIAGICKKARANIAAVNYHFGGKEALYVAVWRRSFESSMAAIPPDGGVTEDAPAEAQLRGRISALLRRVIDRKGSLFRIMERELVNPTGILDEPVRRAIGPMHEKMVALIKAIGGKGTTHAQAALCTMSIINQCMGVGHGLGMKKRHPHLREFLIPQGIDTLIDTITWFSLGGIREVRKNAARTASKEPS